MTDAPARGGISALAADLVAGVLELFRATTRLFAHEARDAAGRVGRRALFVVLAALVAGAGVLLVLVAAGLALGAALGAPWAGFLIVGVAAAALGGGLAYVGVRRLTQEDVSFPGTMDEIRRNAACLRGGDDA